MEGTSIIIPVLNKSEITQSCIGHIRRMNHKCVIEIIIIDNGSTDNTSELFSGDSSIVYIRNSNNAGLAKAYNQAVKAAKFDTLCFMHNDVFVFKESWVDMVRNFIISHPNAGMVGLYGAKTIRRDGSFRGKSIVHSMRKNPSIQKPFEKTAVVDGLLIATTRSVLKMAGGFDERFSIHFYDKNISMLSLKNNYTNYILNIPFEHQCASTRRGIAGENDIREAARKVFVEVWREALPADVSTLIEKVSCIFKRTT